MKIVHIIDSGGYGGAEKYIIDLTKGIKKNYSTDVQIWTFKKNAILEEQAFVEGILVKHFFSKNEKLEFVKTYKKIRDLYNQGVDIFHTHGYKANIFVRMSLFFTRATIVTTVHSTLNYWEAKFKKNIYKRLDKLTSVRNQGIICVSKYIKDYYSNCCNKKKIDVIYNGVDAKKYNYSIPRNNFENFTIINVGSLSYVKNQLTLLKAVSYLKEEHNIHSIKLILVGDGPNRNEIENYVNERNLSNNVKITGFSYNVIDYLLESDIYVSTSVDESFGLSIVEAIMVGRPVIASAVGGVPEIIVNEKYGLLYSDCYNEIELAEKILHYYANYEIREQISQNSRIRAVEKYEVTNFVENTWQMYKSLDKNIKN